MSNILVRTACLLAVALPLAGCGGDGGGASAPAQPSSVTVTISAANGGTINGPGGVVLEIPPEALAVDTNLTVAIDDAGAPALPAGLTPEAPLIALLPHGLTFSVPVRLSVPVPAGAAASDLPPVLKTTPGREGWEALVIEREGDRLVAAITSFSNVARTCCVPAPQPPLITQAPSNCTVHETGWCFFRVYALADRNAGQLSYGWRRNGVPVPGETSPEILINPATWTQNGDVYAAVVTDESNRTTVSATAQLDVILEPPKIVTQPLDDFVVVGSPAVVSAASTSSAPQTLQWKRCDALQTCPNDPFGWTNALGGGGTTLVVGGSTLADDGARVAMCASNAAGTTCSFPATLHVTAAPTAPQIVTPPQDAAVQAGFSANFTVLASGGSLGYVWEARHGAAAFAPEARCGNSATCTLTNVVLADDGLQLRVRVSNAVGVALSDPPAALSVRLAATAALARLAGTSFGSYGLRADGRVLRWGSEFGTASTVPTPLASPTGVSAISMGFDHALALRDDGVVFAWGFNSVGQLGNNNLQLTFIPVAVANLDPIRIAAVGGVDSPPLPSAFSIAANAANGLLWAWGNNRFGQLGIGTVTEQHLPVRLGGLSGVVGLAAGYGHVLARRGDGTVWAWGTNTSGQLGTGDTMARTRPQPLALVDVVAVATGFTFSLALQADGTVLSWGEGNQGQLGSGNSNARMLPAPVVLPGPAVAIAAGAAHALALLADGRVFAWGHNLWGQVGSGSQDSVILAPRPVAGPLGVDVVAIGAGRLHSLALDASGRVWAWGFNGAGQLGDGTQLDRLTPVQVQGVNLN